MWYTTAAAALSSTVCHCGRERRWMLSFGPSLTLCTQQNERRTAGLFALPQRHYCGNRQIPCFHQLLWEKTKQTLPAQSQPINLSNVLIWRQPVKFKVFPRDRETSEIRGYKLPITAQAWFIPYLTEVCSSIIKWHINLLWQYMQSIFADLHFFSSHICSLCSGYSLWSHLK